MKKLIFALTICSTLLFEISIYAAVGEGISNFGSLTSIIANQSVGEGISSVGSLTSIINHLVGVGISAVGTLSSIPTYSILLNQTDYFVSLNQNISLQGILKDPQGQPIPNTYIAVHDALKAFSTIVQTNQNGNFVYNTQARRIGVYQIYFDYSLNNVEVAANNALVDVGNKAIIALFEKIKYYNNSNKTVKVNLKYEGLNSLTNQQNVTYKKDFVVPAFTTFVLVETENFNYIPNLIDKTTEHGPLPNTGEYSIGRILCPVQLGLVEICGPDPEDPNTQVFTLSVDLGVSFGLYYDRKNLDFGVSLGIGANVPYIIGGSGVLTFGSDGLGLNVEGGIGMSKWTVKVFDSETNTGMNAITGVIHSPVDPLFIDPQGRKIGVDPTTNAFVNEIPYASYTGPGVEPQIIHIPAPVNGNWNLTTIGREEGPFTIEKNRYYNNIVDQQIFNGITALDSIVNNQIIIDTNQTTILPPAAISVTLVDSSLFVSWSTVQNAAYYKVYYDSDTSGVPYYGTGTNQGNSPITAAGNTNLSLSGLEVGKTYYLSVTAVDAQGVQSYFSLEDSCLFQPATDIEIEHKLPSEYTLAQNYPNPFNPTSRILYSIPERAFVSLRIYDLLGNEVVKLVDKEQEQGVYSVTVNANNLSSGTYFYQLKVGQFIQTRKMTLIK